MREAIQRDSVMGVRRLNEQRASLWHWRVRPFELLLADESQVEVSLRQIDKVFYGRRFPADFWSTIREVDAAYSEGDRRFVRHPSGERFLSSPNAEIISAVEQILFAEDPIGLSAETNTDEYRLEARMIVDEFPNVRSEAALRDAIHSIFVQTFDDSLAGEPETYAQIARQVWNVRNSSGTQLDS